MEAMKGSWKIDDFSDPEADAIVELLYIITDMAGDYSE